MKLTTALANELLNAVRGDSPEEPFWMTHGRCVGNAAATIAEAIGLDADYARALGYVHDIGKSTHRGFDTHDIDGYELLLSLGVDESDAMICLTHGYIGGDMMCTASKPPAPHPYREMLKNHKYSLYEDLINLCDLMCLTKVMTVEQRLVEIFGRRGYYENSTNNIREVMKLKKQFDDFLGRDIYTLFPGIMGYAPQVVYMCYSLDECGMHLTVDAETFTTRKGAEKRANELTKTEGGEWSIREMKLNYNWEA